MANVVTTSIVVQFAAAEGDGVLIAEVDSRTVAEGGLNGGKTSFLPGDTVAILLYKSTGVTLDGVDTSLGILIPGDTINVLKTEDIEFSNETEVSLRYPCVGGFTFQWVGRNLGNISLIGENTLRIPQPASGYAVGVAKVSYYAAARVYRLQHSAPGFTEYSIVAFFAGSVAS